MQRGPPLPIRQAEVGAEGEQTRGGGGVPLRTGVVERGEAVDVLGIERGAGGGKGVKDGRGVGRGGKVERGAAVGCACCERRAVVEEDSC